MAESDTTVPGKNCSFSLALDPAGGNATGAAAAMVTIVSDRNHRVGGRCRFNPDSKKFELDSSRSVVSVAAASATSRLRYRVQVTLAKPSDGCDADWIRIASDKCAKILRENRTPHRTDPCSVNGAQLITLLRQDVDTKLQEMIINR